MKKLITVAFLVIGVLLIGSSTSVHIGNIRENGRTGLKMLGTGIVFIVAGLLLGLWNTSQDK